MASALRLSISSPNFPGNFQKNVRNAPFKPSNFETKERCDIMLRYWVFPIVAIWLANPAGASGLEQNAGWRAQSLGNITLGIEDPTTEVNLYNLQNTAGLVWLKSPDSVSVNLLHVSQQYQATRLISTFEPNYQTTANESGWSSLSPGQKLIDVNYQVNPGTIAGLYTDGNYFQDLNGRTGDNASNVGLRLASKIGEGLALGADITYQRESQGYYPGDIRDAYINAQMGLAYAWEALQAGIVFQTDALTPYHEKQQEERDTSIEDYASNGLLTIVDETQTKETYLLSQMPRNNLLAAQILVPVMDNIKLAAVSSYVWGHETLEMNYFYLGQRSLTGTGAPASDLSEETKRSSEAIRETDFRSWDTTLIIHGCWQIDPIVKVNGGFSHTLEMSTEDSSLQSQNGQMTTTVTDGNGAVTQTINSLSIPPEIVRSSSTIQSYIWTAGLGAVIGKQLTVGVQTEYHSEPQAYLTDNYELKAGAEYCFLSYWALRGGAVMNLEDSAKHYFTVGLGCYYWEKVTVEALVMAANWDWAHQEATITQDSAKMQYGVGMHWIF
jgi:hypothetical protein